MVCMELREEWVANIERCGFCEDLRRCFLMKKGLEMREYHDLLTHLNLISGFTLSKDRTSMMSSSERVTGESTLILRRDIDGGMLIGAVCEVVMKGLRPWS